MSGPMKRERAAMVSGLVEEGRVATTRTDWVVGMVRLVGAALLLLADRNGDEEELLVEMEGGADDEGERDGGG
jgi:hypothetical protein